MQPCIPHSDVEVAKVIAFKIRDVLNDRAGSIILYLCVCVCVCVCVCLCVCVCVCVGPGMN